jgi:hypothetical protein
MYDPAMMCIFIQLKSFIIVILMYPVLNLTHILNILDKFSMGVTVVDNDYNDDFNVDDLFFVVNSYMQRVDVIGDECIYVKW